MAKDYDYPTYDAGGRVETYKEGGEVKKKKSGFFSKERRAERQERRNKRKINRRAIKLEKNKKGAGLDYVKIPKNVDPKKIKATGKIGKKPTSVTLTEGGAFATYKKESKKAKSFRSAFSEASKAGKKTFMWDGRKYSTKKK